ncbi:MAG: helix-turn-helix domain-containing protein [Chitinophagaceae bacterium]
MRCRFFDESQFLDGSAWEVCNRINFSSLNYFHQEEYTANTYSIKYVIQGTEHYFVNGKKYSVSAGRFLLINKDQPIGTLVNSKKKTSGFCIHFTENALKDLLSLLTHTETQLLDNEATVPYLPDFEQLLYLDSENQLGSSLKKMASQFMASTHTFATDSQLVFEQLAKPLLLLQNNVHPLEKNIKAYRSSTRKELFRRLELAREYIIDSDSPDTRTIAQIAMLSPSHFTRAFHSVYGESPHQYILRLKLEKAVTLLRNKKQSLTELAFECGFGDLSTFSKTFKKVYGMSPTTFPGINQQLKQIGEA